MRHFNRRVTYVIRIITSFDNNTNNERFFLKHKTQEYDTIICDRSTSRMRQFVVGQNIIRIEGTEQIPAACSLICL